MSDPKEPKYKHTVYSKGFAVKVTPSDRAADVMHAMITGSDKGLCGRSIDGVEIEIVDSPDATKMLARSMREIK